LYIHDGYMPTLLYSTEGGGGGKLLRPSPEEPASLEAYTSDWTRKWSARGCPAVLQPRTTEQVSALLRHCNNRGIAVVPQVSKYMTLGRLKLCPGAFY